MKKKIFCLCIIIILLCGCKSSKTGTIRLNSADFFDIFYVNDQKIYYTNYDNSDLLFYVFDINNKKSEELGKIENPYIYSGDIAIIDGNIYFYCNELCQEKNREAVVCNHLVEIDTNNKVLSIIADDITYQTLLYVDSIDHSLLSYKGVVEEMIAITYIDSFNIDEKNGFKRIIEKKYDYATDEGEVILNISAYDTKLYLLVEKSKEGIREHKIEVYDSCGNALYEYKIEKAEIVSVLADGVVSKLVIQDNLCFIRNFSGNGILFELDNQDNIFLCKEELDISENYTGNQNYLLLFSRYSGEMWLYNFEENSFKDYMDDSDYLICGLADYSNMCILISNSDDLFYKKIE